MGSRSGAAVYFRPEENTVFKSSYRSYACIPRKLRNGAGNAIIDNADGKAGGRFIQSAKSFLVNLDRVSSMERKFFVMDNSEHVHKPGQGRGDEKNSFESLENGLWTLR